MTTDPENTQPESTQPENAESKGLEGEGVRPQQVASGHTKWWLLALLVVGAASFGTAWLIFHKPAATPEPAAGVVPQQNSEPSDAENPTEAIADPEAEAAARAEFDAKMAVVNAVVKGADRTALIGDSPTKGPSDATVVLMKFSDFECPFCAVAASDMKTFTDNHSEDVLYVYKHFPLVSIHDEALPAAKAAWAAQQQDQFWIYHDGLFAYQEKLGEDYYVELAEQIGLDMEQFNRDRNSPEAEAAVTQDAELARDLELGGTPSFLMTNFGDSFLLPGGAPQALYDEAVVRLKAAAQ